eukprot:g61061.t1
MPLVPCEPTYVNFCLEVAPYLLMQHQRLLDKRIMSLTLVHIPQFRSTRVLWLYHELAALYPGKVPRMEVVGFRDIPTFRQSKPKWLLDMNPNGKVPTLRHGELCLFEGTAICSYLLDNCDTDRRLLPRNPAHASRYFFYSAWCASTLDNLVATSQPMQLCISEDIGIHSTPPPIGDWVAGWEWALGPEFVQSDGSTRDLLWGL